MTPTFADHLLGARQRAALVLDFAREFGFASPQIVAARRDSRSPGTEAVWVRDGYSPGQSGILVNDVIGVLGEFDSTEYHSGGLPAGGLAELLLAGP
jgi:hypothetical protein